MGRHHVYLEMQLVNIMIANPVGLIYNPRQNEGEYVKNTLALQGVRRLFLLQVIVVLAIAIVVYLSRGIVPVKSVVLAGLVNIVPNVLFARKLFQFNGARSAKKIINSLYYGEALKIIMSATLFATVFAYCKIEPVIFFITYIVVQITLWFAPAIFSNKQNRPKSD